MLSVECRSILVNETEQTLKLESSNQCRHVELNVSVGFHSVHGSWPCEVFCI